MSRLSNQPLHSPDPRDTLAQPRSPTPKESGWTNRQRFIQAELDTFLELAAPPSELRLSIIRGLLRQDVEGQDRRFLAWRTWFSIEHSVIDEHREDSAIPWGLAELARFDDLILPHFMKVLAPQEKEAFVEFAIKHLSWVAYNGFKSSQHIETTRHAVQLLRRALPEVLEHSTRSSDLLERLGHVLVPLFDPSSIEDAHELLPAVYSALEELLKSPVPWHSIKCFEGMSWLHSHITWQLNKSANLGEQVLLSDYINQDSEAGQADWPAHGDELDEEVNQFDWEQYSEDDDLSELAEVQSPSTASLESLNLSLLRAMVQATSAPDGGFWSEFLTESSLADPTWLLGLQGLERSNSNQYDAFVHRLTVAASQSPFGARHLIALAILDDNRSWRPARPFISTLSGVSEQLTPETKESLISQLNNVVWHYDILVSEAVSDQVTPPILSRIATSLRSVFGNAAAGQ